MESELKSELKSSSFENFPMMNRLLREHLVGRTVVDLMVDKHSTVLALDNGAVLEMPGFSFEFKCVQASAG